MRLLYNSLQLTAALFMAAQSITFAQAATDVQLEAAAVESCLLAMSAQTIPLGPKIKLSAFDAEKRKTINKSYSVSSSDLLTIDNTWGRVSVNTWDRSEIKVKVDVVTRAASDSRAQNMLDEIKIIELRDGKIISFKTDVPSMQNNGNTHKSIEVNYTVYMPERNSIAIKNTFGDVSLASLKGRADINVRYGSLKCDRLSNTNNVLKLTYGSGSCGYINGGNVDLAYFDMSVDGVNGLQGSSKYGNFNIGDLRDELSMDVKYGSFRVGNVSKGIRKISVDSGFSPININFEENTSFDFDIQVQLGSFVVDKDLVNITSLERRTTSASYKGKYGGASGKGFVSINSKYGDVMFTK